MLVCAHLHVWVMRTVHTNQPHPFCIVLYAHPPLYKMLIVDNVDHALADGPHGPHDARAKMRRCKVWTLWTCGPCSLNRCTPICLFFKQGGFSFNHLNSPQCPQTPQTLVRRHIRVGHAHAKTLSTTLSTLSTVTNCYKFPCRQCLTV
jgi:hypothetical protein